MRFVLPNSKERTVSHVPAVTYALIAANACVYLATSQLDQQAVFTVMGLIPAKPSISAIVTSMFLHADLFHLFWNMAFLWLFGRAVENVLGHVEYGIFYFGSGLAAALLHVVVAQDLMPEAAEIPMLGSSGAIAGILGIYAIRFYRSRLRLHLLFLVMSIPAWVGPGVWLGIQVVKGTIGIIDPGSGGIAYWSHIGGMVFGMLLGYVLRMGSESTRESLMLDARESLEKGTTWDAVERLLRLLKQDPMSAEVHRELGRTYAIQENHSQAVSHYRRSIEISLSMGDREGAVESFRQLKERYPEVRLGLKAEYWLARWMVDAGDCELALPLLIAIADTYPGTPEAEISLMKAGDLELDELSRPKEAVDYYERFLREYPESSCRAIVERSLSRAREKLSI